MVVLNCKELMQVATQGDSGGGTGYSLMVVMVMTVAANLKAVVVAWCMVQYGGNGLLPGLTEVGGTGGGMVGAGTASSIPEVIRSTYAGGGGGGGRGSAVPVSGGAGGGGSWWRPSNPGQ